MAPLARDEKRRVALSVPCVDVGAPVEEEADDGRVAMLAGEDQRRGTVCESGRKALTARIAR